MTQPGRGIMESVERIHCSGKEVKGRERRAIGRAFGIASRSDSRAGNWWRAQVFPLPEEQWHLMSC